MAETGCLKDGHFQNLEVEGANTILGGSIFNKLTYTSGTLETDADGWDVHPADVNVSVHNGIVETTVFLDLAKASAVSGGTLKDVISKAGDGYFMVIKKEINGYIFHVSMTCVEEPTVDADKIIDLVTNTEKVVGAAVFDASGQPISLITVTVPWTLGTSFARDLVIATSPNGLDSQYVYLATGGTVAAAGGNLYETGKFIIKFLGVVSKPDGSAF